MENHPNPELEKCRLSEDRLRRFGEQVTKIRGWILERARNYDQGPQISDVQRIQELSQVAKKLWQREKKRQEEENPVHS